MTTVQERMERHGLVLPPVPEPIGNYVPFRFAGSTLYLCGVGPRRADGGIERGKVGADVDVETAHAHARLCGLNLLSIMQAAVGDLERIECVLKVFGMVNAVPEFQDHPRVIDGCTDVFVEALGDAGKPARSAIGMGSLPRGITVEVEAIALIRA